MPQFSPFILLIVMFGFLYFFTIRPQKKRAEQMQKQRDELKIGDMVVTIGGIRGRITALRDDAFEIETGSDHMRVEFLKNALSYVVKPVQGYEEQEAAASSDSAASDETVIDAESEAEADADQNLFRSEESEE